MPHWPQEIGFLSGKLIKINKLYKILRRMRE